MQGKVKFFNRDKGYGFIIEDGTDAEYFVHHSGLRDPIVQDDRVIFDIVEGKKGTNAVNVELVDRQNAMA